MDCDINEPLDWDPNSAYHGPTLENRNKRIKLIAAEEKAITPFL